MRWVNVKFECNAFYPYLYLQLQRQKIWLQNEMDAKVQETKNNVSTDAVGGINVLIAPSNAPTNIFCWSKAQAKRRTFHEMN